ncbi:MAG: response regulator transcription factor [Lachnospiraceae bacterium]|nr:response regulator transcription factor [Lachnospiraceae bacterium]
MNVIIVDDDTLVSLSLKTILEASGNITVVATGKSGKEAISLYKEHQPDVLLMDIRMDEMNGLDAATSIITDYPDARILLLTTFSDDEYIIKALKIGARGYILKQAFDTIAPAINAVYNGQTVFGDEIMNKIPSLINASDSNSNEGFNWEAYGITSREYDIILLVAEGLNNKEIANQLCFSEGTVRNYLSTILDKLSLRDRTGLACFYYKHR